MTHEQKQSVLTKYLPLIVLFLTWIAGGVLGYSNVKADITRMDTQIKGHEQAQAEATQEQNKRLDRLESKIDNLIIAIANKK